jgi:choline dehydrogenase-like flavoprotein
MIGGSVTLNPRDPLGKPVINSHLLESPFDILAIRQAIEMMDRQLLSANTWKEWKLTPTAENRTDEGLYELIRNTARHGLHAIGTSSMSPIGARHGVVDPDLKVKTISGLRIVDASVLASSTLSSGICIN